MDRYFSATKSSTIRGDTETKDKTANAARYKPYPIVKPSDERNRAKSRSSDEPMTGLSSKQITKLLLTSLDDETNPITHSDIGKRSDHVVSMSTGHQVSEGSRPSSRRNYLEDRTKKLDIQRNESADISRTGEQTQVLHNVLAYINGYLSDTTDIEMKRIVIQAGGAILPTASGATHILTSMQLSGSKTHKLLTKKQRKPVHVVKPEWVFDSINAGKRLPERQYSVITNSATKNLHDMWK